MALTEEEILKIKRFQKEFNAEPIKTHMDHWNEQFENSKDIEELENSWGKFGNDEYLGNYLLLLEYLRFLISQPEYNNILEIGSYTGKWTKYILDVCTNKPNKTSIICADIIKKPYKYLKNTYYKPLPKKTSI